MLTRLIKIFALYAAKLSDHMSEAMIVYDLQLRFIIKNFLFMALASDSY